MNSQWYQLAQRILRGLDVQPGEIIQVRGEPGSYEFLLEMLLAVEIAGATPLPELFTSDYLDRLWSDASLDYLSNWDQHRAGWLGLVHRVVTFPRPDIGSRIAPVEKIAAWRHATERLTNIEEQRLLPFLVAAVPTEAWARALSMPFEQLEAALLPALLAPAEELADEARRVLKTIGGRQELSILTRNDCVLHLQQGERAWLIDDGLIDPEDRRRGAIVSNLPAGSIYSTVLESETRGCLWLPKAGEAKDVTLLFQEGRIVDIQAAIGAEELKACLFRHTGEPGRVSHIGIGLNPYLRQPVGWDIPVDEHVYGYMFIALGENRYMGGVNESSLNVDFMISGATFMAGDRAIVYEGEVTK